MEESELDRIDPEPVLVKLDSGFPVEVVRLKTRQLFRLLRILTRGAGPAIAGLDFNDDSGEFAQRMLGILVMAIPDAEQETVAFLQSMCKPAELVEKKAAHLTKADSKHNDELWLRFNEEMFNPEIDDTLSLLETIVANEAPELQALGKKLRSLWEVAKKSSGFGKGEKAPENEQLHLPEPSPSEAPTPSSSTFSATPTGGPTSTSSTSRSAASASARKRRAAAEG